MFYIELLINSCTFTTSYIYLDLSKNLHWSSVILKNDYNDRNFNFAIPN